MKAVRDFDSSELGEQLPQWGGPILREIGRVPLKLLGWRLEGEIPNMPKLIAIGAPHTSNWDFVLAIAAIWAMQVRIHWLGKHTFVDGFGARLWRKLGGIAVNRAAAQDVVSQVAAEFEQREKFVLGLAPEGTRKKVGRWKTGFYRIAVQANVPIIGAALDYSQRVIRLSPVLFPSGDLEADLMVLQSFFRAEMARYPEQF